MSTEKDRLLPSGDGRKSGLEQSEADAYGDHRDEYHGGHTCPADDWRACERNADRPAWIDPPTRGEHDVV